MESMRRLHFGPNKHAEFTAHVHILDLHNVPLVEGECRIKWRFQNGMSLNHTNNEKVMGQALQTSISYLKDLRNAAAGTTSDDREKSSNGGGSAAGGEYGDEGDHSLGGRFKDAISHAHRSLRASTLSHGSGDHLSPRSRSLSMPKPPPPPPNTTNNGQHTSNESPTSPSQERDHPPIWKTTTPTMDYFRQGGRSDEPIKPSGSHNFFGGSTTTSPPTSPRASAYATNNLLSPTTTVRPHGSPRQSQLPLSPATPPARRRQSTSANHDTNLSRRSTALPHALEDSTSNHTGNRSPASLVESLQKVNLPSKAEVKGKTDYMPLVDHQVRFDKHMVCAVAIPMKKNSKHLEESVVKLKVLYKVRTTPLPEHIGSRPATIGSSEDGTRSPISQAIRNHKTRINGSSVSLSAPASPNGTPTLHINTKEAHEEICLGDLWINLSEFVSVDFVQDRMRGRNGRPRETWITRRYLLQNGRTNALLRVAVKMDWISGVRDFTAPPLTKGQIISPKKQLSKSSDKSKDKDKDKASIYSGTSTNSSNLYLQGDNPSLRSFGSSADMDGRSRPLSLRKPFYGRNGGSTADNVSEDVSIAKGHGWDGAGDHHRNHHHHGHHGVDSGLDDDQADLDIIDEIFARESTPEVSPTHERKAYFDRDVHGYVDGKPIGRTPPHNSTLSEVSTKSHHHSPAQALAFLHRSKDKNSKPKVHTSGSTSSLAVDETKGRKRVSSAPSKSIFGPLRANSRSTTPLPAIDHDMLEVHGSHNAYHHHHRPHHHGTLTDDELRPVLVHIPTRQEPIDVHSHPFKWRGKTTPAMQQANQSSASVNVHGSMDDSGYAIDEHGIHRGVSVNIAALQHDDHPLHVETAAHAADGKRTSTTSAAAHLLKRPFKVRSNSIRSTSSSLASAPPAVPPAADAGHHEGVEHHDDTAETKTSEDIGRGSIDLQKTLRPSSEGDPSRLTFRRMTSPASMTPAEQADLQLFIKQNLEQHRVDHQDQQSEDSRAVSHPKTTATNRTEERRQSVSQLQRELEKKPVRGSRASSHHASNSSGSRSSSLDRTKLVRQPTNEEELDARARRLRERGLLPTLSVTISDELPARSPALV